ncbi:ASTRA-associated protein 1 [Podosphaera aphanis]|nr:ASTRA-associated protein 1 [Podosphaera aphanis]
MALPSAQPTYVLRGHGSQIHAATFVFSNARLVTGDAEGWIVIWDLAIKRPTAVWRAHGASILGIRAWGSDILITHGKDNKLIAWKFSDEDEASMSTILPIEASAEQKPWTQPWLLNILHVNTMNFCSFDQVEIPPTRYTRELLIAVPNTISSETVDIFHLPSSRRLYTVPASPIFKGGMVMSLSIFFHPLTSNLTVIAAFESGHTSITHLVQASWTTLYVNKSHVQPILSLDVAPDKSYYLTSGADAIIAQHAIPSTEPESPRAEVMRSRGPDPALRVINTKHAGQQGLTMRNDGKIFATAGWDGRVRIYAGTTLRELAVLKWHQEGCYAVAFTDITLISDGRHDIAEAKHAHHASSTGAAGSGVVERLPTGKHLTRSAPTFWVQKERVWKARNAHWVAVGSKDGKVSLWDIY